MRHLLKWGGPAGPITYGQWTDTDLLFFCFLEGMGLGGYDGKALSTACQGSFTISRHRLT